MGAICPKPKKDDNWLKDSEKFLEDFVRNLCDDNEQCKDDVITEDGLITAEKVLEEKKKSEKYPEDPKKLRFN